MNPYRNTDFFSFISLFFERGFHFLNGSIGVADLASDEVQIVVLFLVSLSASLVGLFLFLRKNAMLANALSHTILLGIVFAYFLLLPLQGHSESHHAFFPPSILLLAAFLTGLFTTFLSEFLTHTLRLQEDASIGLVFTTLFALGIFFVTILSKNAHIGVEVIMGNADALHRDDIGFVGAIALGNLLFFLLFFKEYVITTFDSRFAKTQGFRPQVYHYLLMTQAAMVIIGGFRAVGVLLILAFLVAPPLIARLLCQRLVPLLLTSVAIAWTAVFFGVALSRHLFSTGGWALSTGGLVVSLFGVIALGVVLWREIQSRLAARSTAR